MKRVVLFTAPLLMLLASCTKGNLDLPPVDESVWLQQERGVVVFADFSCPFYVVETRRGFTLMRTWGGPTPFEGSIMYGDFSRWGVRDFYNRSERRIVRADVRDYWLGYWQALDAIDWNCR